MSEANTVIPELVLGGLDEPEMALNKTSVTELIEEPPAEMDDSMLNEQEKAAVKQFAEKIDIKNSSMVMTYGMEAQKKISYFSETALSNVKTKDMGEVGGMLTGLVKELREFSTEEEQPKGLKKIFGKGKNAITDLKLRYDTVEKSVNRIAGELDNHKIQLMKDIAILDEMYEQNLAYYKELTMYILAGKEKLEFVKNTELKELREQAQRTNQPEIAQQANDLENMCSRFEKKVHDLDLTRMVSIQMAPQIRLVQNNDSMMVEKIQSSLINTIPLWKNQMVLALGLQHSREAMEAQRSVSDMTNELLKKNADALKMGTIETAKEAERGIVDIETLQYTNQSLIETMDEVLNIQQQGRERRQAAEQELRKIEDELKNKLLEVR